MKAFGHIVCIAALALVLIGVPVALYANPAVFTAETPDAISSATTIQEAPSGHFTIYINERMHAKKDVLADWETFFRGEDAPLIMEDITCIALAADPAGVDMAKSLQSRLPENQMKLRTEEAMIALSKAEAGVFDCLVMSDEAVAANDASRLESLGFVKVVHR